MNKEQGTTLIELMVGLVLSLGLIAGIGSLFLNMQKSNRIQRTMATMADDSGYVLEVLQKEIRRTGGLRSRSATTGTDDRIFVTHNNLLNTAIGITPTLTTNINFSDREYIKGSTLGGNDAFAIRYQLVDKNDLADDTTSNGSSPCTQNILLNDVDTANEEVDTDYGDDDDDSKEDDPNLEAHVANVYFYLNGSTLSCAAQRTLPDTGSPGAQETCAENCTNTANLPAVNSSVALIGNVVTLVMRYGVDSDADNAANYYTDAATVPTVASCPALNGINESCWKHIVSVRLSVVVRSEEHHLTNAPMPYTIEGVTFIPPDLEYTVGGVTISTPDLRIYKVFTTTIALRNQLI